MSTELFTATSLFSIYNEIAINAQNQCPNLQRQIYLFTEGFNSLKLSNDDIFSQTKSDLMDAMIALNYNLSSLIVDYPDDTPVLKIKDQINIWLPYYNDLMDKIYAVRRNLPDILCNARNTLIKAATDHKAYGIIINLIIVLRDINDNLGKLESNLLREITNMKLFRDELLKL